MDREKKHRWKFMRAGGVDQVVFQTGEDIIRLPELDQKLWVCLACPTRGLELDPRTLDLLDTDKDGRIRAPEILAAVEWIRVHLKDPSLLLEGNDTLSLSAIDDNTPSGEILIKAARRVLQHLGKVDASQINLTEVLAGQQRLLAAPLNGDAIVTVESAPDPELGKAIGEIIATVGSLPDRNEKPGVDQAKVDLFFKEAAALLTWHDQPRTDPSILPLGDGTDAAFAAVATIRAKVNDYFARCRLTAYDPKAANALNPSEPDYQKLAPGLLTLESETMAGLPLATAAPNQPLPLAEGVNPAWNAALQNLRKTAIEPLLGPDLPALAEKDWINLQARLRPYQAWKEARPATSAGQLGPDRLRELLASDIQPRLTTLLGEDKALAQEISHTASLEKLLRLKRDFVRLLNNFVSFRDFYGRRGATFQAGTLYLDGRGCDLTIYVSDPAKHAGLAAMAKAYLAYCECHRPGEKMNIVAAFTAGDSDYLMVGRNGLFYDRQGRDWDATITKIIDNPISIRAAFLSPYKKFVRMIEEQIAKRAAASDAEAQGKLSNVATSVSTVDKQPPPPAGQIAPTEKRKMDVGTVAALGVALGSISAVLVAVFTRFVDLGWWIPVGLLGIVLAISGPSMLIAWLKLRQRNLGPILDANGWAVNGRMKINVPFGGSLSQIARLPAGAEHQLTDPFVERHLARNWLIFAALLILGLVLAWRAELLNPVLPAKFQHHPETVERAVPGPEPAAETTTNLMPDPALAP